MREFLIKAREKLEMTHEDVANEVGITRQYYGMLENGIRTPGVPLAKKISKVLNVDWTLFFEPQGNEMFLCQASNS